MPKMSEEDPLTMYIVVRESLHMSLGKTCVQVGHVTQRLQQQYQELSLQLNNINQKSIDLGFQTINEYCIYYSSGFDYPIKDILNKLHVYDDWLKMGVRKISLKADEKEWIKLKELPNHILITDAGHTELPPGTETVIGFWPMLKSQRPKLLKRLQTL
jgi:peptidyl-tRNA hydrolase